MKIKKILLLTFTLIAQNLIGLDYFGDINQHEFKVKLTAIDKGNPLGDFLGFPCYLSIKDGVPILHNDLEVTSDDVKESQEVSTLNIANLSGIDLKTGKAMDSKKYLEFIVKRSGWSSDNYILEFLIPFDLSDDEKQMLKLRSKGVAKIYWEDPKSNNINVISYWSGIKGEMEFSVEVIKNTLGYNNKLGSK